MVTSRLGLLHAVGLSLAVIALALSGCLDDGTEDVVGPVLDFDKEALTFNTTYHFGDDWSLGPAEPLGDTRKAALGTFYTRWAVGDGFPEWNSAPLVDPMVVHGNVALEFWVGTDRVVTSTPGIFPDFVVYFGSSDSVLSVVSPTMIDPVVADFSVLTPGEAVPVRAEFELPPGGITIPSGTGVRVVTAPVMMENEASDLYVYYGSQDYPSRVSFTRSEAAEDPARYTVADSSSENHVLTAGTFLHGNEVPDVTIHEETITITDDHTGLLVDLDFTGNTPFPDMDLYVLGPNGDEVALSVTPGADESVHLYKRNLEAVGPGDWTIKVVNYVTVQATFTLTKTLLTSEPAPPATAAPEA